MAQLELKDATLNFELKGKGEPVLFIQGCGVTGSGWRPQVDELCADLQCLSFDNRGIGRSTTTSRKLTVQQMAEDARALLDAVDWEAAHVVGHSLGGVIAQQLALDVPHRVKSLSLLCTFCRGAQGGRVRPRTLWLALRTRIGSPSMRRRAFLQMLFPRQYLRERNVEQLAHTLAPILGRDLAEQPPILMKQVRALAAHDCSAQLLQLSHIPTLVVSAKEDPIALSAFGRELAQAIGNATYVELEKASHGVCLQEPQTVNRLLRRHIEKATGKRVERSRDSSLATAGEENRGGIYA
jgi:pimeloyl-ACP methyl ester carboxylesterase